MTKVDTDVSIVRKRQLPVWMTAAGSADKPKKSGNEEVDRQSRPIQALSTKAKGCKEGVLVRENKVLLSETRKRTRRETRNNEGPSTSCTSSERSGSQKKALKGHAGCEQKSRRKTSFSKIEKWKTNRPESNDELESLLPEDECEDEVELNVEDLFSIAQEYVNADDERKRKETEAREFRPKASQSSSPISFKIDVEGSSSAGTSHSLSKCTTSSHSSHLAVTGRQERASPELEVPTNFVSTGDAAQDMLDLFLGPLLTKPDTNERKSKIFKKEDRVLSYEPSKEITSGSVQKLEAPVEKKKSSLRDKVAMFLD